MCYRRDLFQAAGLPADRDAVSALWPTWDKFIETAQKYRTADRQGHARLGDHRGERSGLPGRRRELLRQGQPALQRRDAKPENLVAANSPAVKQAWETAVKLINANATAKTATWSTEWNNGFKNGTFAATFCPSWMTGIVQNNSGAENSGKWDVAAVPGGGGNWGGSWLAVPTQSKYPTQAADLAKFLTSAEGQVAAFKAKGPLPTNLTALQNPQFQSYQNAYFNNAPTGKIFGDSVAGIKPLHPGPEARRGQGEGDGASIASPGTGQDH